MTAMLTNLVNGGCDALDAGDNDRAIELLSMPADLRFGHAMFNLAIAYKRRGDIDESIHWYQVAAGAGDVDAMAFLGWIFEVLGDTSEAAIWYKRATACGHPRDEAALMAIRSDNTDQASLAARTTSRLMAQGHMSNGMRHLAVECWSRAAFLGDAESMYCMGQDAVARRDLGEAILWHAAASRNGFDQSSAWLREVPDSNQVRNVRALEKP